jgi:hypothetical protein
MRKKLMKSKGAFFCASGIICLVLLTPLAPVAYGAYGDHDGPYGEDDGIHGGLKSTELPVDSRIKGWITAVEDYWRPEGISHGTTDHLLGQPGDVYNTFSLGDGGWIIVTFDHTIANGPGPDFVVWENGFISRTPGFDIGLLFAELMFVEVSTDGDHFARFPSVCLNPNSVGGFGCIDPSYYHNVAGKHPCGNDSRDEGTPFELDDLQTDPLVIDGTVDLDNIQYVKLVDVVGDGSTFDPLGNPMVDPYPTPFGSGGADLNAAAVLNVALPNEAPTADAGQDQMVDEGDTVTLDGSDSSDPDDGIASYQWAQTAGPLVILSDSTIVQPTFTAPDVGTEGASLTFELTVTDNGGLQATDTMVVAMSNVPTDRDGDGLPDDQDAFPDDPNEWLDTDGDGIGNNADDDDDDDSMPDVWEEQYGLNSLIDDSLEDLDEDEISNMAEYMAGTDPSDPDSKPVAKGDINGDGSVDLKDVIVALQVLVKMEPTCALFREADVNADGKIGMEEAVYVLQKTSGVTGD